MDQGLYLVATPIGNLGDITLRALDVLKSVDVVFCEDTRRSIKLMNHFEIKKPLRSCPHFKEKQMSEELLERLSRGERVAFISDAGTPGIADPGAWLVRVARENNHPVHLIGGISSLSVFISGIGECIESFKFVGFLPSRTKDRELFFENENDPVVFFESPHRIEGTIDLLIEKWPQAKVVLAKELSKISERFFSGHPQSVKSKIQSFKGEWIGYFSKEKN